MKTIYKWTESTSVDFCPWCRNDFRTLSDDQFEQADASCSCPFCTMPVVFNFECPDGQEHVHIWPIMTSGDADYILGAKSAKLVQDLFRQVVKRFRTKFLASELRESLQASFI